MAQIFHRSTNTLAKVTIVGALIVAGAAFGIVDRMSRSGYTTRQGVVLQQPVPFSHDHHVTALGIDCRYCHTAVEESSSAGIPPVATCMNCHKQIWNQAPMLEPVRAAFQNGRPIRWTRVHDLPDYVYFNHSIHVARGVACVTCHGRVDQMPLMYQNASLLMSWCIDCHRDTQANLSPPEEVFSMTATRGQVPSTLTPEQLAFKERHLTSCSTCHR
jgi:hypothetical protein